jgi:PAS domain S-box-containing protein
VQGKLAPPATFTSAFFTSLLERTVDALLVAEANGRCRYFNQGAIALLGYELPNVQEENICTWVHPQDGPAFTALLLQARVQSRTPCPPFRLPTADKQWIWLSGEIIHMGTEADTPVLAFLLNQVPPPAPKPKRNEQEWNRDLQQLTNMLSHNLQAPIANALGLVNLLAGPKPGEDLYQEIIRNLEISARQLDSGIKDINLILSMRDNKYTMILEDLAFEKVFSQVMQYLSGWLQKCQGQISLEVAEGYTLRSHQTYLFSILYNLISHAIRNRSPLRPLQIQLSCVGTPEGGTVISFADNGQDMDLQAAGKGLFKFDKQLGPGTRGRHIGLYLVKTHIDTLGGQIEVCSSPDQGTRFLIHLPS